MTGEDLASESPHAPRFGSVSCLAEGVFTSILDLTLTGVTPLLIFEDGAPAGSSERGATDGGNDGRPRHYF